MKPLKIWKPTPPDEEPQFYLGQRQDEEDIDIVILDAAGQFRCRLLAIDRNTAAITRYGGVDTDLGFILDEAGRVSDTTDDD